MARMAATERRAKLLEAARRVISRDGVAAATTRAVAAEAQMPLASFHYVFESQQELMREMILAFAQEEAESMQGVVLAGTDVVADVSALLNRYVETVVQNRARQLAVYEIGLYALRTPGVDDLAATRVEAGRRTIRSMIGQVEAAYGTKLVTDADELARLLLVLTDGIAMVLISDGDEDAMRRVVDLIAPKIEEMLEPVSATARES